MKKSVLISTLICAVSSASAFAHHPAADIVDPEIYAMIDENVADTPHADLTFDDMGSSAEQLDSVIETAAESSELADTERGQMAAGQEMSDMASVDETIALASERGAGAEMAVAADDMVDTIDMLDSVVGQLAE
jgi:hypothetical protein